jgi:hypothetical protein
MAKGPSLPGQKALAKALNQFKESKSAPHRAIYKSLTKLDAKYRRLSACITKCATDFEEAEVRSAIELRQRAERAARYLTCLSDSQKVHGICRSEPVALSLNPLSFHRKTVSGIHPRFDLCLLPTFKQHV